MYIKRKLEGKILKYLNSPEIIAVVGPRQCGKTTMLKKIFDSLDHAVFLSFDDRAALNMFNRDIDDFAEVYVKNKKYLFIDEFQYAKNGGKKLKYLFDAHKIKIFISGSSAIDLTVNALKYLVGRIFVFNLFPLDFEEFLSYKNKNYLSSLALANKHFKSLASDKAGEELQSALMKYYEEYAIYGGYPRVVLAGDDAEKQEVLKNIFNTYFLREVRDILGLIEDYKLEKLISGLALQIGNLIEYNELAKLSEFTYPTLKKYSNFLEKTFICARVKPYFNNKRTEIVKNPKIFFYDSGLRNIIINDFRKLDRRPDAGALLENAVFCQLTKGGYEFNYWRDKKKHEVDFVLKLADRELLAVEIKSRSKTNNSASIVSFNKIHPEAKIILVYANVEKNNKTESLPKDSLIQGAYLIYAI